MLLNRLTCVLLVSFLLASCGGDETDNSQTGSSTFTAAQDWCEASMGLRESSRVALLDISRAHVGFRLFGPTADWIALDERLQEILQNQTELNDVFLEDYAGAVGDMCVVTPSDMTPVYAEVTMWEPRLWLNQEQTFLNYRQKRHMSLLIYERFRQLPMLEPRHPPHCKPM